MPRRQIVRLDKASARKTRDALMALDDPVKIHAVMSEALVKAAQPMAQHASSLAPVDEGYLSENITVIDHFSRSAWRSMARHGYPQTHDSAVVIIASLGRLSVLNEFGTMPRRTRDGRYTGYAPAQPFMAPAWEGGRRKALETVQREIWPAIERMSKGWGSW